MPPAPIYLDNNSTTPIHPEVAETMLRAAQDLVGNPASQHSLGRKTRRVLEEAREGIVSLLGGKTGGMDADRLIFTSGGTEANQLAIRGLVEYRVQSAECKANVSNLKSQISNSDSAGFPPNIAISSIEHPSALGAAEALAQQGFQVRRLAANANGLVDTPRLSELLD